jgi:hypothetical protein
MQSCPFCSAMQRTTKAGRCVSALIGCRVGTCSSKFQDAPEMLMYHVAVRVLLLKF